MRMTPRVPMWVFVASLCALVVVTLAGQPIAPVLRDDSCSLSVSPAGTAAVSAQRNCNDGTVYVSTGTAWVRHGTTGTQGVAAGYVVARGTITLDGSNPSSATTGLAAIVACTVQNKRSTTPGDDPVAFTIATAAVAGRLDVYAWKTDGTDPTLVASTDADDTIDWICVGT
jgi:hypothetical protein